MTSTTAFCIIRGVKKSKEKFFGRDSELAQLEGLWSKDTASLVTCRGRRRIGKSTLIEEFSRRSDARFIKLEGLLRGKALRADGLREDAAIRLVFRLRAA